MAPEKLLLASLPTAVRDLAALLQRAGGRVWLVGGPVRDGLRGEPIRDFDLATDLEPHRVGELLPSCDQRDVALGAARAVTPAGEVVITSLREESDYHDHRHPRRVVFVREPARDAARRDFTVNALYLDLGNGELLDPSGGRRDLQAGVLRAIGQPRLRFEEDALRLLRLWRFHRRLGFQIEADSAAAARQCAGLLAHLSAERVYGELQRTFTGPGRGGSLQALVQLGLASVILPEVAAMAGVTQPPQYHPEGDVLIHTDLVLGHVPADDPVLAWAAVLHDIGKPPTWRQADDRIRFDGHDQLGTRMAEAVLQRLHAPRELQHAVLDLCREHIRFAGLPGMRKQRRERFLRGPAFPQHLAFHRADCLGSHGNLSLYETLQAEWRALPALPERWLTGADVLALGVAEGPLVGQLLATAATALEDHDQPSRALALALLRDLAAPFIKTFPDPVDKGRNRG